MWLLIIQTPSWPGFVPAIHVFLFLREVKTLMPGTRPGITNFLDWLLFETDSAARNCRKRRRLAVSIKCGDIVVPKRKIVAQFAGRSECNPRVLRYDVVERSGPTEIGFKKSGWKT
jgi:hypothetical protein